MTKPRFILTLEAKPDPTDPGAIRALRRLLKQLLRSGGFRCVTATPVVAEQPKEQTDAN